MERNRIFVLIFLIFFLPTGNIFACGPWFDNAYLVRGEKKWFLTIPEGNFLFEIERITGSRGKPEDEDEDEDREKALENTANADIGDLREALKRISAKGMGRDILVYKEARSKISDYYDNHYKIYESIYKFTIMNIGCTIRYILIYFIYLDIVEYIFIYITI